MNPKSKKMIDFGIIAAGEGSRLQQEGSKIVKPLVEVDGKPILGRLVRIMERAGANSVSVIVNEDMPQVWEYLQNMVPDSGCELRLLKKSTPSSMHSFYELLNLMKPEGKFVVTTVDTIFREENFREYVDFFESMPHDIDGAMGVSSYIDDESPLYIETEGRYRIIGFSDFKLDGIKYVSAGVYGLHTNAIPVLQKCIASGESRMRNFQRSLIDSGLNLDAFDLGKVIDIDHVSDISKAQELLRN